MHPHNGQKPSAVPPESLSTVRGGLPVGWVVFAVVKRGVPVNIYPAVHQPFKVGFPFAETLMDKPEAEFSKLFHIVDVYRIMLQRIFSSHR